MALLVDVLKEEVSGISDYTDDRIVRLANQAGQKANDLDYGIITTTTYESLPFAQYEVIKYYIAWTVCMDTQMSKSADGNISVRDGYSTVQQQGASASDVGSVCENYESQFNAAVQKLYGKGGSVLFVSSSVA